MRAMRAMRAAVGGFVVVALLSARAGAGEALVAATGLGEERDPVACGRAAASRAKQGLGKHPAKCVLVFDSFPGGAKARVIEGVAAVFPRGIIHGCSAYGPLTEKGNPKARSVGVLALGGSAEFDCASATGAKKDQAAAGRKVAQALPKRADGALLVLFGDCHVPSNDKLVAGAKAVLGERFPIVGGAAPGGLSYFRGEVLPDAAVGVLISGKVRVGCAARNAGGAQGVIDTARSGLRAATGPLGGEPTLVFAFDCGGRRGALGGRLPEELAAMKAVVGEGVPIFGFYGSGEIGPRDTGEPSRGVGYHVTYAAVR